MAKLSAREVASITKPGRHSDGEGLFLKVGKPASDDGPPPKSWTFRYMRGGTSHDVGLGRVKVPGTNRGLTLSEARAKAAKAHRLLADGVNVKEHYRALRRQAGQTEKTTPTFAVYAEEWIRTNSPAGAT